MACAVQTISPIPRRVPLAVSRSAEACRTVAAPPLGNRGKSSTLPLVRLPSERERRAYRKGLLKKLQKMVAKFRHGNDLRGLQGCCRDPAYRYKDKKRIRRVEIHKYADGLAFMGLSHCGGSLYCPVCAPKVHAKRRGEIKKCAEAMIAAGFSYAFITLTVRHTVDMTPEQVIEGFQKAAAKMQEGDNWTRFREKWRNWHRIRAAEVTFDGTSPVKTGTHWHTHNLYFFEMPWLTPDQAQELKEDIYKLWINALKKVGLDAHKEFGISVEVPSLGEDGQPSESPIEQVEAIGEYMTLSGPVMRQYMEPSKIERMSYELSPLTANGKKCKREGRVDLWGLMEGALGPHPEWQPLLMKVILTLKHKSQVSFSPGLKSFCGIEDKSDKELMIEHEGDAVFKFDLGLDPRWVGIHAYQLEEAVLEAIKSGVGPTYAVQLAAKGVNPVTGELGKLDEFG